MNCNVVENKLVDYIDGLLTEKETINIKEHIASCESCKKAYTETVALLSAFSHQPVAQPSEDLKDTFELLLTQEKLAQSKVVQLQPKKNKSYKSMLQIAASIALLFTGYLIGGYQESRQTEIQLAKHQKEQQEIKENMMLAMIDNTSPSTRIKAVNYSEQLTSPDIKILEALIDRMKRDSNSNVRLSAVEALSKFIDSELVKTALIEVLAIEKNPSIQIEVIQILVQIQEKRALEPIQKILDQPEIPDYLKTQASIGISKLTTSI